MKSMFIKEFITNLIVIHVFFSTQISLQEDKLLPKFEFDVAVLWILMWLNYESQNSQSRNPSVNVFPNPILTDGFRDCGFWILTLVAISAGPFFSNLVNSLRTSFVSGWLFVYMCSKYLRKTILSKILLLPMINDEYKGRPPIQGIISLPTNRLVPQLGIFKQVRHSIHTHLRIFYQVFFVNICVIKLIECDKNAEVVCHRLMSPTPSMLLSKVSVSESGSPLSTINQVVRHHWKLTDPIDTLLQPEVENMLHLLHYCRVPIVQVRLCCLEQKHHKRIQTLKLRFEGFRNLVLVIVILTTPFRPSPGRTSDLKVTL